MSHGLLFRLVSLLVACTCISPAAAQDAEDELGNWLIYNGTVRVSDRWSVFTEAQLRLYELASNPQESFVRAAGQYHFNPKSLVALGYMYGETWPFDDTGSQDEGTTEDRIYEQFTIKHSWSRTIFEHRYRLEQRWVERGGVTGYSGRTRYRLQITSPLNRPSLERGAFFLNAYDEIFVNLGSEPTFDQNRLYFAGGYQFDRDANLQVGYLWQARSQADFHRLQIFLTYNFDFRKSNREPDSSELPGAARPLEAGSSR
jgi:hypothetical protein